MQAPFGGVQIPQLALQHTSPPRHTLLPQGTPPLSLGREFKHTRRAKVFGARVFFRDFPSPRGFRRSRGAGCSAEGTARGGACRKEILRSRRRWERKSLHRDGLRPRGR